ncbi:hypothetical protein AHAS_Ahas16G0054800 [Arachis hypogaea]
MDDPLDLLFVWTWERMPWLASIPRQQLAPADILVARRLSHHPRTRTWMYRSAASIRHAIDFMEETEWFANTDMHSPSLWQHKPYQLTHIAILFAEYSPMIGTGYNGGTDVTVVCEIGTCNQSLTLPRLPITRVGTLDHTGYSESIWDDLLTFISRQDLRPSSVPELDFQKAPIQIWLFEQKDLRIEGRIIVIWFM